MTPCRPSPEGARHGCSPGPVPPGDGLGYLLDGATKKFAVGVLGKTGGVRSGRVDVRGGGFEGAEPTVVVGIRRRAGRYLGSSRSIRNSRPGLAHPDQVDGITRHVLERAEHVSQSVGALLQRSPQEIEHGGRRVMNDDLHGTETQGLRLRQEQAVKAERPGPVPPGSAHGEQPAGPRPGGTKASIRPMPPIPARCRGSGRSRRSHRAANPPARAPTRRSRRRIRLPRRTSAPGTLHEVLAVEVRRDQRTVPFREGVPLVGSGYDTTAPRCGEAGVQGVGGSPFFTEPHTPRPPPNVNRPGPRRASHVPASRQVLVEDDREELRVVRET